MTTGPCLRGRETQRVLYAVSRERAAARRGRAEQEPKPRSRPAFFALEDEIYTVNDADAEAPRRLLRGRWLRREQLRHVNTGAILNRNVPLPPERPSADEIV